MYKKITYDKYINLYNNYDEIDEEEDEDNEIHDYVLDEIDEIDKINNVLEDNEEIEIYNHKITKKEYCFIDKIFETFEKNNKYKSFMDLYGFISIYLKKRYHYLDIIIEKYTDRLIKIMKDRNIKINVEFILDKCNDLNYDIIIIKYLNIFKEFIKYPINLYELSGAGTFLYIIVEYGINRNIYIDECKYLIENSNEFSMYVYLNYFHEIDDDDIKYIIDILIFCNENVLFNSISKKIILYDDNENKITLYDEFEKCKKYNYKNLNTVDEIINYIYNKCMYLYTFKTKYLKYILIDIENNDKELYDFILSNNHDLSEITSYNNKIKNYIDNNLENNDYNLLVDKLNKEGNFELMYDIIKNYHNYLDEKSITLNNLVKNEKIDIIYYLIDKYDYFIHEYKYEKYINYEYLDEDNNTFLHIALMDKNHIDLYSKVNSKIKVNYNIKNNEGESILSLLIKNNYCFIESILKEKDIDFKQKYDKGNTILHLLLLSDNDKKIDIFQNIYDKNKDKINLNIKNDNNIALVDLI